MALFGLGPCFTATISISSIGSRASVKASVSLEIGDDEGALRELDGTQAVA
jgi:hypothetical protein